MTIAARGENARGVVLVFWTALAILALHAATDSFIAPEPGTGPLDHLLRGSVSLAILVVAAVVYPRLQAGGRAAQRDDRIGGMGFSVGGEMMLQAAASNTGLRAVVSEGAGVRSVREDLLRGPRGWLALPESAVQSAALTVMSGTPPPPALDEVVGQIGPRPLFLIYAAHGGGGEELNPDYFEAASEPKTVWRVDEAEHVGGFDARPRQYAERVIGFFDQALLHPSD